MSPILTSPTTLAKRTDPKRPEKEEGNSSLIDWLYEEEIAFGDDKGCHV
jgi:hypothetical protein